MAQLVYNNIIHDIIGGAHEQTVEIQVALGGAASPAGFLHSDGDAPVGDAHKRGKIPDTGWDDALCSGGQKSYILIGKGLDIATVHFLLPLFGFDDVFVYPVRFLSKKAVYF